MISKIFRFYHTVKYLKFIQIYYQIWYRLKPKYRVLKKKFLKNTFKSNLSFENVIENNHSWSENRFNFLNLYYQFENAIDWNFSEHGKLFTYNINYFDYLNQGNLSREDGTSILQQFIENYSSLKDGLEPYPTSLRILNVIKFIASQSIDESSINELVAKDYFRLQNSIEYHLLGNHLLENYFALFWASIFLQKEREKYTKLLMNELAEQVLSDGGHFERSPMYHQLILYRVLDTIQLLSLNVADEKCIDEMRLIASKMLGWLNQITFSNGLIPLSNDSAYNINPSTEELNLYAKRLEVEPLALKLMDSNFRKFTADELEVVINIGNIQASYQPGHAHADHFTFDLCFDRKHIIVDTGISTYENCPVRHFERSTIAHNTVVVENQNSSDVWSAFRVAKRAEAKVSSEKDNFIDMSHDGYAQFHVFHHRSFLVEKNCLKISDRLSKELESAKAIFHFHPEQQLIEIHDTWAVFSNCKLDFFGGQVVRKEFFYAPEFNKRIKSICIEVNFQSELDTTITF